MKPWIKEYGEDGLDAIRQKACEYIKENPQAIALTACTDSYQGVNCADGTPDLPANLLDLRIFGEKSEFWAHRTTTAHAFSWRTADDDYLEEIVRKKEKGYFADPDHYRITCLQKLDIDTKYKELRTTGGRYYHLPISNENAVRLVRYVEYDDQGSAHAVDFRMAGFERNPEFDGGGKKL